MRVVKWYLYMLLGLLALSAGSCSKDHADPWSERLADIEENTVVIYGAKYTVGNGKYFSGMYPFFGFDCTTMYIECSSGAGITIEIDEKLVGRVVTIEPGDTFWFFAVGDGQQRSGAFLPLQNDNIKEGYSGWFRIERNIKNNKCALQFEIEKDGSRYAAGKVNAVFERLGSL